MVIEAHNAKEEVYEIKQPLITKDTMLKIFDFNLYKIIDNLELRDGVLYLYFPENLSQKLI